MAEMLTGSLERVFSTLAGRGNVTVIFHLLGAEVLRFSELERAMPGISQRQLVKCLRELEAKGVVRRVVYQYASGGYGLTWGEPRACSQRFATGASPANLSAKLASNLVAQRSSLFAYAVEHAAK
jgi:hypothetical protein